MKEKKLSEAQILLVDHLQELGFKREDIHTEFKFWGLRDWRFDVAIPYRQLAFECHGGQWTGGHRRPFWSKKEAVLRKIAGFKDTPQEDEYHKLNVAIMAGWRCFQFSNEQILDGRALQFLKDHQVRA